MSELVYLWIFKAIPAWVLIALAGTVALGWAWRLRRRVMYLPPLGYKIGAVLAYAGIAGFYVAVQWSDWTTLQLAAMSRVVLAVQLSNEIGGHAFALWMYRKT